MLCAIQSASAESFTKGNTSTFVPASLVAMREPTLAVEEGIWDKSLFA